MVWRQAVDFVDHVDIFQAEEIKAYRVLRFWNNDVLTNIEGVYEIIRQALVSDESPSL